MTPLFVGDKEIRLVSLQRVLDEDRLIVENILLDFCERQWLVCGQRRITRTRGSDLVFDLFVLGLKLLKFCVELRRFLLQLFSGNVYPRENVGNVLLAVEVLLFAFQQFSGNTFGDRCIGFG